MRKIAVLIGLFLFVAAGVKVASAGPIIIDGTDSNDHGTVTEAGNIDGWKYMQVALEHLSMQVYTGTARVVVDLGTTPDPTCTPLNHDARTAINFAFYLSSLPANGWQLVHVDGAAAIAQWLQNASTANTGILYIPTFNNLCGDLQPDEMAAINANAQGIINLVNGPGVADKGGALFAMGEVRALSTDPAPYGWLTAALPGVTVFATNPDGINTPISLTPDGIAAFPGLTDADLSTGPWHDWFAGDLGSLRSLAVAPTTGPLVPVLRPAGRVSAGPTCITSSPVQTYTAHTEGGYMVSPTCQNTGGTVVTHTVIIGGGANTAFGPRQPPLVTKVAQVQGGDGHIARPEDTVVYTITIKNTDPSQTITSVNFIDTPDVNTRLTAGSVNTTQGTVISGNVSGDSSVNVDVGSIAPAGSVVIVFSVTVNNPLPAGIRQVANQGLLNYNGDKQAASDDPNTPAVRDATVTPVINEPLIYASKVDWLYTDADHDNIPSAGDTIAYTVTVANTGLTATQVVFNDVPGIHSRLVVGSVSTSRGTVILGNTAGDSFVRVDIGTLAGGDQVVITFRVNVDKPLPAGAASLSNQGAVTSREIPAVLTDDPRTPQPDDPTATSLALKPSVAVSKRAVLYADNDNSGGPSAGDVMLYDVTIVNSGNAAATGVLFNDTPDPNTTLLTGTVTTSGGVVVTGNNPGDTSVAVNVGTVPAGFGSVDIKYRVRINNPVEAAQICNQGVVSGTGFGQVLSGDPDTQLAGDPTCTTLVGPGKLAASKTAVLYTDANHDGLVSPGDTLLYKVTIANVGSSVVTDVVYNDNLDPNTALQVGSVQVLTGTVTQGNTAGDHSVQVVVGDLLPGQSVEISYRADIANPFPGDVTSVTNQGTISSSLPPIVTCDPTLGGCLPTVTGVKVNAALGLTGVSGAGLCALPGATFPVTWTVSNVGNIPYPGGDLNFIVTGSGSAPITTSVPAIPTNSQSMLVLPVAVIAPVPYGAETVTVTGSIFTATAGLSVHICAPDWRTSDASGFTEPEFVNGLITYTWHISNTGDADAIGTTGLFTLPQPAGARYLRLDAVVSWSSGSAAADMVDNRVVWTGNVPQGTGVTVVIQAHASFGLPHNILQAPFMIDHAARPPEMGQAVVVYPYKLYFMIVLKDSPPPTRRPGH